uniref:Uncharacterized protein n=1 Tax=Plectus sambesii TaxID=2011161 RepID=A0A914XFW7_9BILA
MHFLPPSPTDLLCIRFAATPLFRPPTFATQLIQAQKLPAMSVRTDELLRLLIDIQCRCSHRFRRWNSTSHVDCCRVDSFLFARLISVDSEKNDSMDDEVERRFDETYMQRQRESEWNAASDVTVVNYTDSLDSLQECDASSIFYDANNCTQKMLHSAHSSDSLDNTFNAMYRSSHSRHY